MRLPGSAATKVAAYVLIVAATLSAQQPVFRTRIDLVQIDVVVVDADGRPVTGLTKSDFEIIDKSKPREIAAFDEISHVKPPAPVLPATLALDVADNSSARSDRLIVLILDDLHFQNKGGEVKDMARRVVESLGPQATLALVTTSGVFGVEPTEDRALLLAQIDRFIDKFDPEGKGKLVPQVAGAARPPGLRPLGNEGQDNRGQAIERGGNAAGDLATFFGDFVPYKTLSDVAKKIGADDGRRKAFVWISGGNNRPVAEPKYGKDYGLEEMWFLSDLSKTLDSLSKSNVAAYAVHTGEFGPGILNAVAGATGGFVMDMRNFDRDLDRLINDLDHYYLLGFYPDDAKETKFRPIEVKVNRPGLTVRSRKGYIPAGPPKPPKSNKDPLAKLSERPMPATNVPLRLAAVPLPASSGPSGKDARVALMLEVRAGADLLMEPDGFMRDTLKYTIWAVDMNKKKATDRVGREATVVLRQGPRREEVARYQVQTTLDLSPGRYQLRASATSAKIKEGGSVFLEIDVPDFAREPVALSGVSLGYAAGPRVPLAGGAAFKGALPFEATLDREFTRADTLKVFCDVAGRDRAGAAVLFELLNIRGELVKPIADRTLTFRDVPAGGYILRVTATAGAATAKREVGLVVR